MQSRSFPIKVRLAGVVSSPAVQRSHSARVVRLGTRLVFLAGNEDNLRDRDNLSTKDKRPVPNVSVIRRFTCTKFMPCCTVLHALVIKVS